MKDVFQASEQQIKTPPQSDEKATVPQLKLSQLEQQTPSTPSPTPSPTAQPDAPATAAVASAAEPAAEPEPVVVEAKESAAVVSETPTPEKSSSPAPRLQPEVQPEAAPSNAARAQQAPDNAARSTQQAPSEAAPTQAPSKAAKGPIGFLLLIPALLVAGVCVVAAIPRSGEATFGTALSQWDTNPLPCFVLLWQYQCSAAVAPSQRLGWAVGGLSSRDEPCFFMPPPIVLQGSRTGPLPGSTAHREEAPWRSGTPLRGRQPPGPGPAPTSSHDKTRIPNTQRASSTPYTHTTRPFRYIMCRDRPHRNAEA